MNRVNDALIKLLSISTNCSPSICIELKAEEWQQLYNEAEAHQIHLVIFEVANKYGKTVEPSLFENWKRITIYQVLRFYERFTIIGNLLNAFKDENIPVIALKGLYVKHLYPQPERRTMGDIDILIKHNSLNDAMRIIKSFGYEKTEKDDPKHFSFYHKQYIFIELHVSLVTETRRKLASNINNDIWKEASYFGTDEMNALIPSDINNLLYCCIHMTNHFGKGGFGLRQLSDFNLLARKINGSVDWNKVIKQADSYGIGKFTEAMLYICNKLFSLRISDELLDKYSKEEAYIESMIQSILDSGTFGLKNWKTASGRISANYINKSGGNSKPICLQYIFPPRKSLSATYAYARKYAFLLPFAWIHRLIINIFRSDLSLSEKIPNSKNINEYVKLFRWLDIK